MKRVLRSSCIIGGLFLCTFICAGQTAAKKPVAQPTLAQVLSWLPADTETVMGANGPFPLPDLSALGGNPGQTELSIAELELRTRALPLTLFNFKNGGLSQALKGKIVAIGCGP